MKVSCQGSDQLIMKSSHSISDEKPLFDKRSIISASEIFRLSIFRLSMYDFSISVGQRTGQMSFRINKTHKGHHEGSLKVRLYHLKPWDEPEIPDVNQITLKLIALHVKKQKEYGQDYLQTGRLRTKVVLTTITIYT